MKSGILGSLAVMFAAGWGAAQGPAPINIPTPPSNNGGTVSPSQGVASPYSRSGAPANAPAANGPVLGQTSVPGGSSVPGLSQAVHSCPDEGSYSCYFSADYLLWKVRNGAVPLSATAIPVGLISVNTTDLFTTAPNLPGVQAGTSTVGFAPVSITSTSRFGATSTDYGDQCGYRLTAGCWIDPGMTCGIEASFFQLERGSDTFAATAAVSGNQFLIDTGFTRNLFLVQGGAQTQLASFPIFAVRETVSSTIGSASNSLLGTELNARCIGLRFGCVEFGGLVGARYILFQDELNINNQVRLFRPAGFPVTQGDASASLSSDLSFTTQDRIRIDNHFIGGHIGAEMDAKCGAFFFNSRVKFGLGTILQHADIDSQTRIINRDPLGVTPPGQVSSGGLLVGPTDVGDHEKNRFGFVTEVNLKLGYQVTECFRGYVGFDGLYMGHMARAGLSSTVNSLNTNVNVANSTNNVNVAAPAFRFREQDIFVRGFSFGCEVRY